MPTSTAPRTHPKVVGIPENLPTQEARNGFAILRSLDVAGLAVLKQKMHLGEPQTVGPQTLAEFLALCDREDMDLNDTGIKSFKSKFHLSGGGDIGPTTADKWIEVLLNQLSPDRGKLAEFARAEANKNLSWTGANSDAEKLYLAPLRPEMIKRGHLGQLPVFYDWCGAFVLYCCRKSGFALPDAPPHHFATFALVDAWRDWARATGTWVSRQNSRPQVGDIIVFDWDVNGISNHIGIVTDYQHGSGTVETAEGNHKNRADVGPRPLNNTVTGYIRLT